MSLIVYRYATGLFSGRQIKRGTTENAAVRLLRVGTPRTTMSVAPSARKRRALASQVLELAAGCCILKVGGVTMAIDNTKGLTNASKHSAVSHGHAQAPA